MAVGIKELKAGNAYTENGNLYLCLFNQQNKQGRLSGKYMVKRKDIKTGSITEVSYNPTQSIELAHIDKKKMTYSYNDGNGSCVFMDMETYETIEIPEENLKWELNFLLEGNEADVTLFEGQVLGVSLPANVVMQVTECEQAVRGNTARAATKTATLQTGWQIKVPLFLEEGEMVQVDTETGEYKGRA